MYLRYQRLKLLIFVTDIRIVPKHESKGDLSGMEMMNLSVRKEIEKVSL